MKFAINILLFVSYQIILSTCQQLDFSIESPNNGDLFLIKPTESTLDLTIKYSLGDNINSISNICFKINSDIDTNIEILKETCFPQGTESITFTNVQPDKYRLYAITTGHTDNEIGPIIEKSFEVKRTVDLIPKLNILNNQFQFLCDEDQDETIVNIDYNITENRLPIDNFLICGQLVLIPDNMNITDINCFETIQSSSFLSMKLKSNYYQLHLFYQDKLTQTYLEPEKKIITFEVSPFQKYLPFLKLSQYSYELVINPDISTSDLSIPYSLNHQNSEIDINQYYDKIDICIEIINIITSQLYLSLSCMIPSIINPILIIQNIPSGHFKANLILRNRQNPSIIYSSSLQVIDIEAKPMIEFLPTYEWQNLKKWHTIPIGLETKLPLSTAGGRKQARIPPIWRTQISLPTICHTHNGVYFLRVQLERYTELSGLRELAATSCKLPTACIRISLDGISVPFDDEEEEEEEVVEKVKDNEQEQQQQLSSSGSRSDANTSSSSSSSNSKRVYTVESTQMFNKKVSISIRTELGEVCTIPLASSVTPAVAAEAVTDLSTPAVDSTSN